jgi:TolB protein
MLLPTSFNSVKTSACPQLPKRQRSQMVISIVLPLLLFCTGLLPAYAQQELDITRYNEGEEVPISLSGFSSESLGILKFDLEIQGFIVVDKDKATFALVGSQNGQLAARLSHARGGDSLFYKGYPSGNSRRQAHTLSNDVVKAVFGHQGIANTLISFRGRVNGYWEIFVSDFDGHNTRQVTRDASNVAAPTWVPNQLALYYTTYKIGSPNIISHDLQSGNRQRITRNSGLNTSAALSPKDGRLAMILSKSGSPDLYVANKNGSGEVRLTRTRDVEACPCWSPDGNTLCFTSGAQGGARLFTMPASGGSARRLQTGSVRGEITEPDWSPDGKWIAFTSMSGGVGRICVMKSTGGQAIVLAEGEDPSWAPNSRNLVFMQQKNGRKTLSLLDVPTKQVKYIRQTARDQSQPSWAK